MNHLKMMLAGLLLLLPMPALADVTARYTAGPKNQLVVEADDRGNSRIGVGEKFATIHRDGVDYLVAADATGNPKVAKLADVVAVVAGQLKISKAEGSGPANETFQMSAGATDSLAGYSGTVWLLGPKANPGAKENEPIPVLICTDPALAPIGAVFRRLAEIASPMLGAAMGDAGNLGVLVSDLFAKGTPLRVGPLLELASVSMDKIAVARFDLPGTVLEPMEFLEAITPSQSGGGLPALP